LTLLWLRLCQWAKLFFVHQLLDECSAPCSALETGMRHGV